MKNKLVARLITLLVVVGMLASILPESNASARIGRQAPLANTEEVQKLYLPITTGGFPLQTIFGAELNWISDGTGLDQMSATQMTYVRRNRLMWSVVEPVKNARQWDYSLDGELRAAAGDDLQIILTIRSTPDWAQASPGSSCGPIKPEEYSAFADFVHDAVVRYSASPYNVSYFEIWNEPDTPVNASDSPFGCWGDVNDPYYGGRAYGEMLNAVYPQVKSANPKAQVLLGGLLMDCNPGLVNGCKDTRPSTFLDGILQTTSSFDGVSFHSYDYYTGSLGGFGNANWGAAWNTTGPVVEAKVRFLQDKMAAAGISGKYLINTESALITDATCDSDCESTKAYYVAQVYAQAIALGLRANIWYSALGWRNSGLLNEDLTPKPAYTAYSFARDELINATLVAEASLGAGVMGYEFEHRGQSILMLWSLDGNDHAVHLPWAPAKSWDVFGNALPVSGLDYTITKQPVYFDRYP